MTDPAIIKLTRELHAQKKAEQEAKAEYTALQKAIERSFTSFMGARERARMLRYAIETLGGEVIEEPTDPRWVKITRAERWTTKSSGLTVSQTDNGEKQP